MVSCNLTLFIYPHQSRSSTHAIRRAQTLLSFDWLAIRRAETLFSFDWLESAVTCKIWRATRSRAVHALIVANKERACVFVVFLGLRSCSSSYSIGERYTKTQTKLHNAQWRIEATVVHKERQRQLQIDKVLAP